MENSDTDEDERAYRGSGRKQKSKSRTPKNRHSYGGGPSLSMHYHGSSKGPSRKSTSHSSNHRRSSAPMPQPSSSGWKSGQPHHPYDEYEYEYKRSSSAMTPRRSKSEKGTSRRTPVAHSTPRNMLRSSNPSRQPGGVDDESDEQKRIRWEQPKTHHYQLTGQPRLLEEKFLNVIESVQTNMTCSQDYQNSFNAGNLVWSLLESNQTSRNNSMNHRTDSNSQAQSTEDGSIEDSLFEDGPSVVEISDTPPVFSESITASESLLSSSQDYDDENDGKSDERPYPRHSHHRGYRDSKGHLPADSSQILDDLSGMESERRSSGTDSDKVPRRKTQSIEFDNDPNRNQEPISVVNKDSGAPAVKIYSTSLPFEMTKEKKCPVGMQALQDIQKARSDKAAEKKEHKAFRQKLKDNPHIPPIPDINVGCSHEVSTISASEGSYNSRKQSMHPDYRNFKQDKTGILMGGIPENKGLKVEPHSTLLFDNSFQDETKSCIPISFQRKKRSNDGATASFSSKSLGMRLLSRSGEANTTSEKENEAESPYIYEYETGVNTYVAYYEVSTAKETRPDLQVIEHPNPPLLPFGSNEVVVRIEVSSP